MNNFYLMTKRLGDILSKNSDKVSLSQLENFEDRRKVILYLAEIYKLHSEVVLTPLDYKNIYSIMYVICLPNFGKRLEPQRVGLARDLVSELQHDKVKVEDLIDKLLTANYYA